MPESIFSGAQEARFQDAGGSWGSPTSVIIKSDSESSPEMPSDDETSAGDILFAGEYKKASVNVYTLSAYSALRSKMASDARIDFQIKDMSGNWQDVALDFIPRVQKPFQFGPGARRFFTLEIQKFTVS